MCFLKFLLCHPGWLGIRTGSRLVLNSEKLSRLCLSSAFLKHMCHHAKSYICSLNNCFTYLLLLLFVCACVHASEHGWIVQQFLRVSSLHLLCAPDRLRLSGLYHKHLCRLNHFTGSYIMDMIFKLMI